LEKVENNTPPVRGRRRRRTRTRRRRRRRREGHSPKRAPTRGEKQHRKEQPHLHNGGRRLRYL